MVPVFIYFFFNRAAMGERGSLFTRGLLFFFFNHAAMGRARFLVYPWFIIFLIYFLTARPWAERGSWFTRGFFFFDFCASRPKLPLGQILSHATCDLNDVTLIINGASSINTAASV